MLSRTADNLFWMTRYLERAETAARLLEVGTRNTMLPTPGGKATNDWQALLQVTGLRQAFKQKFGDINARNVETALFFDPEMPASVAASIGNARENARTVRTALTSATWDAMNVGWQELGQLQRRERSGLAVSELTEWTTRLTTLLRGTIDSTQLRNDGYHFMQLGYALERGESTARLMDVKYYILLPDISYVGSGLDHSQWAALLRSMSAYRAFSWVYPGELTAAKIAHFLILNRTFPRSILATAETAAAHLEALALRYGRSTAAQETARALVGELAEARIEDIFEEGLHEFLVRMTAQTQALTADVQVAYLGWDA